MRQSSSLPQPSLSAWRPAVSGVHEVLHARFLRHEYPAHTHDTWTLLIVDAGTVAYQLDNHAHSTFTSRTTLLPPHVPHDGRSVTDQGFRKRVIYLEMETLGVHRAGRAVDRPDWCDAALRQAVHQLHTTLRHPGDDFEAESRLALVTERLVAHLDQVPEPRAQHDPILVRRLRDLLDDHVVDGFTLAQAATELGVSPTHLVRAFRHETGIPPHRYLIGRRLDRARRLLLDGKRVSDVAAASGFYDQAHLTRHFRRLLGVTPGTYASSGLKTVASP